MCTALLAAGLVLGACSPQEAGDMAAAPPTDPAREGIPEDILKVPDMGAMFPGAAGGKDEAYWFMPYAAVNEQQGIAMVDALTELAKQGKRFPEQLPVAPGKGAAGTDFLYPLQDGVERRFIASIDNPAGEAVSESTIPMIISQPEPGAESADVLYMDGHIATVRWGRFPMTEAFIKALSALDPPEHAEKGAPAR